VKKIRRLQTSDYKIKVVNLPLSKNMFLGGWMDVNAVLVIAYSNQKLFVGKQSKVVCRGNFEVKL
jgi:hypothetical protein